MATRFIDVTFDNGETYTYEGVPFDATPEQAQARIAQDFPDLLVTSIDGSRTSEGVTPQAPVQPASTPSIVEAARTAQTPVAAPVQALGEGERVVFGDDVIGGNEVAIQQLNPETKKAIEAELATYKGNPEFSSETVNEIYNKYGIAAGGPTDEKYIQAMREGRQVGGVPVGEYEAQQKRLEDEAIAAQATEMAKGLEDQGLFSREFEEATLYGFPGWLGNIANDWLDTGKEELRRMYPGESEDWYEQASEKIVTMTQRSLRQAYEQESERNPTWKPDEGMISNIASFRWFPAVAGSLLGSVGPESFLAPGASATARIGSQAAISGAAELAYEAGDYAMGVNDGISGENILAATALGGVFQGGMEGLGRILRGQRSGKDIEAEVEAGPQPTGEVSPIVEEIVNPSTTPMPTEQVEMDFSFEPRQMEMDFNAPDLEARLAQEAADFRMRNTQQEPTPETIFPSREEQLEMRLEVQPDLFRNLPEEISATPTERVRDELDTKVEELQQSVDYQMEDWKNAPDTFVIRDYDDLADPEVAARLKQADPEGTAKGVTLEDGSVAIIGKNIEGPEEVRAVLFHEALGHYGASQYFGNALNKNLESFYNNSPSFKEKVDEWMEANPGAYADRPDTIARAADEVLAEMSEGGKIDVKLMDRLKNVVKATLRRIGLKDVEYSEREIMTILGMMHDAVVKGTSVADNGFKTGPRFSNTAREKKSLTPEKMKTKNDIDDLLEFVGEDAISSGPISDVELGRMADDLGLTSSKYLKGKSIADSQVAARLRGAHQVITNTVDDLGSLRERVEAEGMTPTLQASIRQKLGTLQALYARFDEDTAEVGRALRALRLVSQSRQSSKAMDRFLRDSDGINLAADEESFLRFMNHMEAAKVEGGAEAAGKFFNNARKMRWEDYAGSYIFNNMLSSPRTWAVNAGGGLMNHFIESFTLAARATLGAGYRAFGGKGESTHTNELIAQQMGALAGIWNYKTWKDIAEAIKRGEASGGSFSSKVGQSGTPISSSTNKAVKALGLVVENPRRVMAATDEMWSAMFRMSELFRLAAHEVSNRKDFKGNYWDEVKALAKDPTTEMLQKSGDYANEMLFRGKASKVTEGLAKMQRPRYEDEVDIKMRQDEDGKWVPYSRTVKGKDSQAVRVGKFGLRLMVPFAHTLDRIAATMLRNSGPLAVLTPTIRKQLKAGGVEREAALGRIVATSAMLSYFGFMAANGDITGADDPNYKKAFSLSAVTPANSIRLGDEWMSYQGWDPLAGMMSAVSTAYERSDGQLSLETAAGLVSGFSEAMMKSTYAESVTNSMELFQEVVEGITTGEMSKKQATANFLAGQTANLIPAASFTRWMNQNFIDPNSRATKGDSSVADRMTNRIKAGIPFLSDDLPAKFDIFGRPVQNPRQERLVETDPVIKAVHEVDRNTKDIIFGAVSDRVKKDGVPQTKLTAEEHQRYQEVTGLFFYEDASTDINDPLWKELTPEEKQEQLAYRYEEAKKYAREYLFPEPEEVEEEDYVE